MGRQSTASNRSNIAAVGRITERLVVALIVSYFAAGSYNEVDLERADRLVPAADAKPVIVNGLEFASPQEAAVFRREVTRNDWFPWAGHFGMPVCYLMLLAAGGFYGAICREAYDAVYKNSKSRRRYLFGLLIGPFLYGISSGIPYFLTESESLPLPRLATLFPMCLAAGFFAEQTFNYLGNLHAAIFKRTEGKV